VLFQQLIKYRERKGDAIGLSSQLIQPLSEDPIGGKEATESLDFPSILRNFRTVNVEMNSF